MENTFLLFGPPGTGKTTYLAGNREKGVSGQVEKAVEAYGGANVVVCSFTKSAAVEIGSRIDTIPRKNVGTLHSLCYQALECPDLTEGHEAEFNDKNPQWRLTVRQKKGKGENAGDHSPLDDPFGDNDGEADALRQDIDLMRVRRIPKEKWPTYYLPFHHAWTKWKEESGFMDFTDLLEKCLTDFEHAPGNPAAIFFDEAQDASQLQADLLAQWGKHAKRLILAGDDDQAIFFWAGADARSFLDFPCPKENRRYLRESHRVPQTVHELSHQWIKNVTRRENKEYHHRDAEGFVDGCSAQWSRPQAAINEAEKAIGEGKSVMFIASCSYMLEPLKKALKQRGLPFHNPWRRRRGDWNPLMSGGGERMMPVDRLRSFLRGYPDVWGEMESGMWQYRDVAAWASPMESKSSLIHGAKTLLKEWKQDANEIDVSAMAFILQEKLLTEWYDLRFQNHDHAKQSIEWWLRNLPEKEAEKLAYPKQVFETFGGPGLRDEPLITIGTGHSLKGAQADVVFVFPDISAQGWESWSHGTDEDRDGIIRLFYVMMTRAYEGLFLCSPMSGKSVNLRAA